MKRQLSRLECEYVISEMATSKPYLEVSLLQSQPAAPHSAAICSPHLYDCNPNSMSFFFDSAFIKKTNLPHGVPCSFCFFYKTRRIRFTASFSFVNGKHFCRADALFYADDESCFLPSERGVLSFSGDGKKRVLALRIHRDFPLNTANKTERKTRFFRFMETSLGEASFRELEDSGMEKRGILFYLDCNEALVGLSLEASCYLLPSLGNENEWRKPLGYVENSLPHHIAISLKFGLRSIEADGEARLSVFSGNLLLCSISIFSLEMENIRFIYEMSHGKKYAGP